MISCTPKSTDSPPLMRTETQHSLRHPVMFFLTSGIAWLAFSLVLALIASTKTHNPDFLTNCAWLSYGRVFPAHLNALVYGWGMQAAFAVILWIMARHSQKKCSTVTAILVAGHLWNLGVVFGITAILSGNGTGMPWMEFPSFIWPVLLISYVTIVIGSFVQFRVRLNRPAPIASWYVLGAMIWFPWIFLTANTLLHVLTGHPVMAAGINTWYQSALVFLFFMPVALGAAYDLAYQISGRPLENTALAKLGFWSLALIAPWAGMQRLAGVPLPYFLPSIGAAATALLFIPFCAASTQLFRTIHSGDDSPATHPSLRFCRAGIVTLMLFSVASVFMNLPDSTLPLTQFSLSTYGFSSLALYGVFSLILLGAIYFIVPEITGRIWPFPRLIHIHFLFSVYGVATIGLVTLIGGMEYGIHQQNWLQNWLHTACTAVPYAAASTFAWALILISNSCFFLHLILMWLPSNRRRIHPQPATHPIIPPTAFPP